MSMKSWTEEGYGYKLETGSNMKNIVDFIVANTKELPKDAEYGYVFNFSEEEIKKMYECEGLDDLYGYTNDPACWVIANIINNLEGTNFVKGYQSDGDTDQPAMLGIEPLYPWMTKKIITREVCDEILAKYAKILGITEYPDYFEAEYFG